MYTESYNLVFGVSVVLSGVISPWMRIQEAQECCGLVALATTTNNYIKVLQFCLLE